MENGQEEEEEGVACAVCGEASRAAVRTPCCDARVSFSRSVADPDWYCVFIYYAIFFCPKCCGAGPILTGSGSRLRITTFL